MAYNVAGMPAPQYVYQARGGAPAWNAVHGVAVYSSGVRSALGAKPWKHELLAERAMQVSA